MQPTATTRPLLPPRATRVCTTRCVARCASLNDVRHADDAQVHAFGEKYDSDVAFRAALAHELRTDPYFRTHIQVGEREM